MEKKIALFLPRKHLAHHSEAIPDHIRDRVFWDHGARYRAGTLRNWRTMFGPPFTSGKPHLGTIYSVIVKDAISNLMASIGLKVDLIPGFDCHGLPTEKLVESRYGNRMDGMKKLRLCYLTCRLNGLLQISYYRKFGVTADWNNTYWTASRDYITNSLKNLSEIEGNGYLSYDRRLLQWCTYYSTNAPISEIVEIVCVATSCYFLYPIVDTDLHLMIYTTTPWSLPANSCIAYNPLLTYQIYEVEVPKGNRVVKIVAREGLTIEACNLSGRTWPYKISKTLQYFNPITNKINNVYPADWIQDKNTGLSHIAGLYDQRDYMLSLEKKLTLINLHDEGGYFLPDYGYRTRSIIDASSYVVTSFQDYVFHSLSTRESTMCYQRSQLPVINYYSRQLFARTSDPKLTQDIKSLIKQVNWVHDTSERYMLNLCDNSYDWCLSRNRLFNTPILPAAIDDSDRVEYIKKGGMGLDVWYDSSNSFNYCYGKVEVDLAVEGLDQYRGYFLHTLKLAALLNKTVPPFKQAVVTGFVTDSQGEKLSKSKGNYMDVTHLLKHYHPDSIRLWACRAPFYQDITLNESVLKESERSYFKVRNVTNFLFHYHKLHLDSECHDTSLLKQVDQWVLHNVLLSHIDYIRMVNRLSLDQVTRNLSTTLDRISSWYINNVKNLLYTRRQDSWTNSSTITTLSMIYRLIRIQIRSIYPFLSNELANLEGYISAWSWDTPTLRQYFYPEIFHSIEKSIMQTSCLRTIYAQKFTKLAPWKIHGWVPNINTDVSIIRWFSGFAEVSYAQDYSLSLYQGHICSICKWARVGIRDEICPECANLTERQ